VCYTEGEETPLRSYNAACAAASRQEKTMPGVAIFRADKLQRGGAVAMAKHALREGKPVANAIPGAPPPEVLEGARTARELVARLDALIGAAKAAGQVYRANNIAAVDMLFTTTHGALKSKDDQDAFFQSCLAWVRSAWPTAEILLAAVHRDETTPHAQFLMAPLDARGHFNAKQLMGGPAAFGRHQDAFWEAAGRPHGLARGEKGSKARHVPVRTFYAHAAGVLPDQGIELEAVPPAPEKGLKNLMNGEYQAEKAKREEIIQRNSAKAKILINQSRQLRSLHPEILSRQSEKYREAVRLEKLNSENLKKIDEQKSEVKQLIAESKTHLKQIEAAIEHTQTQAYIKEYDQFSKKAGGFYVARLAQQLGIELVPGKGLIDQARRGLGITGTGASLVALQRLDEAAEAAGIVPIGRQLGDQEQTDGDDWRPMN
jgi:rRNA maturation endonuclease Nob1